MAEGLSLASGAKAAVWDFMSNTGRTPATNASAGLPNAASITGNYVASVTVTNGVIEVAFGRKVNAKINGQTLQLSPRSEEGSIVWSCRGGTLAARYRPSSCR
nr:pilin [Fontimonas thermophila]